LCEIELLFHPKAKDRKNLKAFVMDMGISQRGERKVGAQKNLHRRFHRLTQIKKNLTHNWLHLGFPLKISNTTISKKKL